MANLVGISKVRFDINQKEIGSFTRSANGMVVKWNLKITNKVKAEAATRTAQGTTKYGSGLLARSYTVTLNSTGESHCEVRVNNTQPYAKYVFEGTRPMIGSGAGLMPVGKSQFRIGKMRIPYSVNTTYGRGYRTPITPQLYVKGQESKNYPLVALRLVLLRERILIH